MRPRTLILWCLVLLATVAHASDFDDDLSGLVRSYDTAKYELQGDSRAQAFDEVLLLAANLQSKYGNRPELEVWRAWALLGRSELNKNLSGVKMIYDARGILEEVVARAPGTLNGAPFATLGVMYVRAPGFPLSFGNKKKGRGYFEKALALDPKGCETNLLYSQFLSDVNELKTALEYAKAADEAPYRQDRPKADADLHRQAKELISALNKKLKSVSGNDRH